MTTATEPVAHSATAPVLTGHAGEAVAALGSRVRFRDLYDEVGSTVYHDLAGRDTHEVRELLGRLRTLTGPVLELAAGTGRLTMPMLSLGREVTALELSASMLAVLRERLEAAPPALRQRCVLLQGDMSAFALDRRFGAVVLGTTSVSLLDAAGRVGLYRAVRAHLAPGGRFLLSTVDAADTAADTAGAADATEVALHYTAASGRGYRMFEQWSPGAQTRTVVVLPEPLPDSGPVDVCTTEIGVLSPDLLTEELVAAGFTVPVRHALPDAGVRHRDVLLETGVAP
ncbi:daptide-type RiPP biosynthesis methyltransferase [Streptacidiphilus sp. N1-12]|uniref:Daptide-type RiPP biosynthesis methyltransferase n=2 Tax=Streptacidiphilus alkalitolerans TaxID=3342712 RepID=A0ABV6W913_9ACTN